MLLTAAAALLVLQVVTVTRDTTDTARTIARHRIPVTPELLATAYADSAAARLIRRARAARLEQDSSLFAYDAVTKERLSVGMSLREGARERLVYRGEGAARVRWHQGLGARVDVLAARTAIPWAYPGVRALTDLITDDPLPYFPGREQLPGFSSVVRTKHGTDSNPLIHPLEEGAEAYYRYRTGDSVTLAFPDGRRFDVREVKVVAREPRWDAIVGSLWFDVRTAHLVRAVYRPAATWDIVQMALADDPHTFDDVPKLVKPLIMPMSATVTAFIVEYGLVNERWWLPRIETVDGRARMGPVHVSFTMAQSFRYASANGTDSFPAVHVAEASDSASRVAERARRDSLRAARRHDGRGGDPELRTVDCPRGDTAVNRRRMYGTLPVEIRVPCDTSALTHSPELTGSLFAADDRDFGTADRDALLASLGLGTQPEWHPLRPTLHYGLERGLLRYNRVEGLSAGVLVDETFGAGYTGSAVLRIGTGDVQPNAELHVQRSNGRTTLGLGVYRRLNSANDWGEPFTLGSSLGALLWGRDDGFYFRTWGVEFDGTMTAGPGLTWRFFAEEQRTASATTSFSLADELGRGAFRPNIEAERAREAGVALQSSTTFGIDPRGWQLALRARTEGATGTFDYARGAVDATVTHPIAGALGMAITTGAGSSVGHVPVQRLWYLGGVQTVRGQTPGERSGDAYWMGRGELAYGALAVRPVVFFDLGWAGPRAQWSRPGRPISGAGAGFSFLDGLLRLDVSRGIHPTRSTRLDLYVDATF